MYPFPRDGRGPDYLDLIHPIPWAASPVSPLRGAGVVTPEQGGSVVTESRKPGGKSYGDTLEEIARVENLISEKEEELEEITQNIGDEAARILLLDMLATHATSPTYYLLARTSATRIHELKQRGYEITDALE